MTKNDDNANIQALDPMIVQAETIQPNEHEAWIFKNPEVLAAFRQAIKETAAGQSVSRGSFAQYADTDADVDTE